MSHQPPVSCIPNTAKMSRAKKVIEEAKEINNPEIDLVDKGLSSLDEIPGLCKLSLETCLSFKGRRVTCSLNLFRCTLANTDDIKSDLNTEISVSIK